MTEDGLIPTLMNYQFKYRRCCAHAERVGSPYAIYTLPNLSAGTFETPKGRQHSLNTTAGAFETPKGRQHNLNITDSRNPSQCFLQLVFLCLPLQYLRLMPVFVKGRVRLNGWWTLKTVQYFTCVWMDRNICSNARNTLWYTRQQEPASQLVPCTILVSIAFYIFQ